MPLPVQLHFIYTPYLTVSHITIVQDEPEAVMFGLFANLLHNGLEELELQCDFAQINDLLSLADYVADATIEQLADIVTSATVQPQTIDVTDTGGIIFSNLLFCLAPAIYDEDEEAQRTMGSPTEYHLVDFIKKDSSINDFEASNLPVESVSRVQHYLSALSLQYDFYLHFIGKNMTEETARQKFGLSDELVFRLAETAYEIRLRTKI